ncbi:MAG: sigma-70 family RNA polymerase sigma factor [Myxococcaceae bacterium]|nr:sigma-70 family RNA polymerase sigma factor [Myxococcaceae bacterium]MBH2006630.1 sigma-70 family RNA polymerase sigma factor [Myxococcaceae bacterium]
MISKKIKTDRLSSAQESILVDQFQRGGNLKARNALVMANLGLVHFMVGQMLRSRFRYDDLLQEGILGLMRATETFETHRQVRFATYAVFWIRAKMQAFMAIDERDNQARGLNDPDERAMSIPEVNLEAEQRKSLVREALERVIQEVQSPYANAIVEHRLLADEPKSLEKVAKNLKISRETCRLLERKMLKLAKEQLAHRC